MEDICERVSKIYLFDERGTKSKPHFGEGVQKLSRYILQVPKMLGL